MKENELNTNVRLSEFKRYNVDCFKLTYLIDATDGRTTISENLILQKDQYGKWKAIIDFETIDNSAKHATIKLTRWMDWLSQSIKNGNFKDINIEEDL